MFELHSCEKNGRDLGGGEQEEEEEEGDLVDFGDRDRCGREKREGKNKIQTETENRWSSIFSYFRFPF